MQLDLGQSLLLGFAVLCVLPLLVFGILALILYRTGQQRLEGWFSPDHARIEARLEAMRQRDPQASREKLVARIIHEQALKAGIVGAITGLGGFWTLPIALPVDLALSFRIQAILVSFIAALYGDKTPDSIEARVRNAMIITGSSKATQTTTDFLIRLAVRVAGKSFSKVIPILGAGISFVVNYLIVQLLGRTAARWYARQESQQGGDSTIVT